ncbi:MAG: tetratricopeptide repeat protein [Waterburya sp.]
MKTNSSDSSILSVRNSNLIDYHDSDPQFLTSINTSNQLDRPTQQQKKSIASIYIEQAWIYFKEQNWQKAIAACQNALEIDTHTADAYKILGNILNLQGRKAEALGVYAKALTINPNSPAIYANLGSFYAEQRNWSKALDYYQQAVILDPQFAGAYRNLAQIWEELGKTEQALECLCQAINLEPEILNAQEYFSFGEELYQQGRVKEASIFYIQGVKFNSQAEKELAKLVQILEELEEWQQAVIYYHQLMALSNSEGNRQKSSVNKPIKNLLSRSKSKGGIRQSLPPAATGQTITSKSPNILAQLLPQSQAVDLTNRTLLPSTQIPTNSVVTPRNIENQQPDTAISWNNLGSLYAQKREWTKAISCYQEALQLDSKISKVYRNLARVYGKLGEKEQAALYWYEAFMLEPDLAKAEEYFSLAKILLTQEQVEKAIACLHRTIELQPNFEPAHLILSKLKDKG